MVSIAQTAVKPQGGEGAPSNLSEADSYRLVVRFGKDLLSDGFTALPNLLLDLYAELGITHCELVLLLHLLQYKWSKHDPYPSLGTIATKMGLSLRAVQNHVHSLRHKAYQCPHTDEEECSCPKYLEVTPRYRAGIGQTSSSYNLSGLFAAIITLAREKGLLKAEDNAKNCTPPREESCTGGMQKPAYESDEPKNTHPEPDESLSNSLGGKDEGQVSCSHEVVATRNPEGKASEPPPLHPSNRQPSTSRSTHPSPPNHTGASNRETLRLRETGRPRQSLSGTDEVKRESGKPKVFGKASAKGELPRMPLPPLTKDAIDAKREQGLNASGQTALQAILDAMSPREHQETLAHQFGNKNAPVQLACQCHFDEKIRCTI